MNFINIKYFIFFSSNFFIILLKILHSLFKQQIVQSNQAIYSRITQFMKKIYSKLSDTKRKKKILNEVKYHLNELKNAMTSESVFKKTKIMIINNDKMIKY